MDQCRFRVSGLNVHLIFFSTERKKSVHLLVWAKKASGDKKKQVLIHFLKSFPSCFMHVYSASTLPFPPSPSFTITLSFSLLYSPCILISCYFHLQLPGEIFIHSMLYFLFLCSFLSGFPYVSSIGFLS